MKKRRMQIRRLLAQLHGSFTPAHADGCAEQCFEGVQFGSIFKGAKGLDQQIANLLSGNDITRSLPKMKVLAYLPCSSL